MAIKRIEETTSKGLKPYLSEFMTTLDKKGIKTALGSHFGVLQANKTKSKKGWILECDQFAVFIWSKSKSETALLESLNDVSFGYPMIEVKDSEGNFSLVFDDEIEYSIENKDDSFYVFHLSSTQSSVDTERESTTGTF